MIDAAIRMTGELRVEPSPRNPGGPCVVTVSGIDLADVILAMMGNAARCGVAATITINTAESKDATD